MMDWSWSLLDESEQRLLADLSVFRGGFTIAAARIVGNQPAAEKRLSRLQAKSLVEAVDHPTGRRFDLLETVRLYAARKLADSGRRDDAHDRHLTWATGFAQELLAGIHTDQESTWVARADVEMANLVATSEWAFQQGHVDRLLRLLQLLEPECFLRLRPDLGPLVARLVGQLSMRDDERVGIALAISFRLGQGSIQPEDLYRDLGRAAEQKLMATYPLSRLLFAARTGARDNPLEAAKITEPLAEIMRAEGQSGEAARLQSVTALWKGLANASDAVDLAIQAVERCRQDAGSGSLGWAMMTAASALSRAGRASEALEYTIAAIDLAGPVRALNVEKNALELRGIAATQVAEPDRSRALDYLRAAIEFADRPLPTGSRWQTVAAVSIGLGRLGYLDGTIESWAALDAFDAPQMNWPTTRVDVEASRQRARDVWGETEFAARVRSGERWTPDQALAALGETIVRATQDIH